MATIDLGKVALVWKGTFDSATTYESKDVVQFTDSGEVSSYIYVNASGASGQTPSTGGTVNTTYWNKMAGGAAGIWSSGLSLGTAGQVVKVNSGASALEFGTGGGVTQIKQWRKMSTLVDGSAGDSVLGSPFDGGAVITPTDTSNKIRATFFSSNDHGTTWRAGYYVIQYSLDNGSTYRGLVGGSFQSGDGANAQHGNMVNISGIFAVSSLADVKVRVIYNGHSLGAGSRHGQYNNEGADTTSTTQSSYAGYTAAGMVLILEELAGGLVTLSDTA
jgi:hypothetical protein